MKDEECYLYLTTTGRRTGRPREIEIWFTALDGRFYIIAERGEQAQWVKNLRHNPAVTFRVGDHIYEGSARAIDPAREPDLCARVRAESEAKYGWGEGLVIELAPQARS
jgi:deazaflavin-dependent oxidoreductase (nitroreductase family)